MNFKSLQMVPCLQQTKIIILLTAIQIQPPSTILSAIKISIQKDFTNESTAVIIFLSTILDIWSTDPTVNFQPD